MLVVLDGSHEATVRSAGLATVWIHTGLILIECTVGLSVPFEYLLDMDPYSVSVGIKCSQPWRGDVVATGGDSMFTYECILVSATFFLCYEIADRWLYHCYDVVRSIIDYNVFHKPWSTPVCQTVESNLSSISGSDCFLYSRFILGKSAVH